MGGINNKPRSDDYLVVRSLLNEITIDSSNVSEDKLSSRIANTIAHPSPSFYDLFHTTSYQKTAYK